MRYNEIIESTDDDDELFGRGLHHRIAAALLAQGEEDQRVSDEERGLGDLENAAEFAEQARNYRYIADAFNQSMAMGVKVYRSLDRSWKGAVDDVVDIELDMDFRDYVKQIPESTDDVELFGRTGGNFAGMSAQDVKDRWDELNDELYGYEAYWSDEDDAEFQQKESELKALMRYARIRFGEAFYQYLSNWREHSDAQYARWKERTNADPFNNRRYREDPRVTKSGKINKQDQKTLARDIKDRVGTHRQPVLPENDDDDLFSTSAKLDRRQELKAKTIRRIEKRDALNIQPGTRLMVKWDNGKYYKGKVVRLTPSGRVIAQVKFHNVGWPLEKNISPRDIKPEHIIKESESDDELFGQEDGARLALKLFKMLRAAVDRDPRGVANMLKQRKDEYSNAEQAADDTLDYMAQAVGMSREMFDRYSDDFYMMPWPRDVDWRRPWQVWDAQVLDQIIEIIQRIIYGQDMNESDNDDLFSHSVHEEVIYRVEEYKKGLEKHLEVVQQADPEDAEYLEDVINDVNQVLVKLQKNWIAGMDALLQASDSEDWAENIMHELKADNIPVSKYYRAPWLR